jgi:acyl transferase domain-containing protein
MTSADTNGNLEGIAIIGMAGRFPQAPDLRAFWRNLCDGVESISFFSDDELAQAGISQAELQHPGYVKARAVLDDIELFDAAFFGFSPREAEIMDPQHRLFLECAWHALEDAGYDPERYDGAIGVYAGTQLSTYLLANLYPNRDLLETVGPLAVRIANDKDFLPSRASYKLNLKGPSMSVQTACSSSLVAAHLACQSLLQYECDMALVGGVSVDTPQKHGYVYEEGGIYSPDGHCRVFDAQARGTVAGSGLGIVVLKRLEDAVADGDAIYAVIKASALNNDGAVKVGYTASSVDGQAEVIAAAYAGADLDPASVSYVEAHGTGTSMGDPIEIAALTQVFGANTRRTGFCAIGSVKSNIGHLDAGAGAAGLIKTALALSHGVIPPSINCDEPNPLIDFPATPFYVNTTLRPWERDGGPRRAAISGFAVGGTNAHLVLEEPPELDEPQPGGRSHELLVISARSAAALGLASAGLAAYLKDNPEANLADVAYTLQVGRHDFEYRRTVIAASAAEAAAAIEQDEPKRVASGKRQSADPAIGFMFPGQGAQYVDMAADLYASLPVFRAELDRCCDLLKPILGLDLRAVLYPDPQGRAGAAQQLEQTMLTQPALFVIEYALAQQWLDWGIEPQMMIGHSIGEYVAACLAGVFSVEEALALVAARGRLMQRLPGGSMLSVALSEGELLPLLGAQVSLAAVNGPQLCVVAGPHDAIDALQARLQAQDTECRRLHTSHAFHSAMMEPMLRAFAEQFQRVRLKPPSRPYISNVTGTWIRASEATDPQYWVQHVRQPVRFADGLAALAHDRPVVLLEVGPGSTLSSLARRQLSGPSVAVSSTRHPQEAGPDLPVLLAALGKLWLAGARPAWSRLYAGEDRRRVHLPLYPFERRRYWIDPPAAERTATGAAVRRQRFGALLEVARFSLAAQPQASAPRWLVLFGQPGLGQAISAHLRAAGQPVVAAVSAAALEMLEPQLYAINQASAADYATLWRMLEERGERPTHIIHVAGLESALDTAGVVSSAIYAAQAAQASPGAAPARLTTVIPAGPAAALAAGALAGVAAALASSNAPIDCQIAELLTEEVGPALLDAIVAACSSAAEPESDAQVAALDGHSRPELATAYVAPRTPLEASLAELWQSLLGITPIGIHDHFFEIGGHSLLATQVLSRIRDSHHVTLSLSELFSAPTIADIARSIEAAGGAASGADAITPEPRDGRLPLSFAQQRLWFINQIEPDSSSYNMPFAVRIAGPLDQAALGRSFQAIVQRHEALRTIFAADEGKSSQIILPELRLDIPTISLEHEAPEQRTARLNQLIHAESQRIFNLAMGPLLRITLFRLGPDEHIVLLVLHHIVADGWSLGVLMRELAAFYEAAQADRPAVLPELPIQYADFAAWQRRYLQGEVLERHLAYWKRQLGGDLPRAALPLERPEPLRSGGRRARHTLNLPQATLTALNALSEREGATLFMTLLAAFKALIHAHTGQTDLVIGTDVANRTRSETEGLIGFFINQLVLRTSLAGDPAFRELLGRVARVALDAYDHQDLPFDRLVEALNPERGADQSPFFKAKLVLQNTPLTVLNLRDISLSPIEAEIESAQIDLLLNIAGTGATLEAAWEYNTDVFEAAAIARLADGYALLINAIISQPDIPLSALAGLIAAAEREHQQQRDHDLKQARLQKFKKLAKPATAASD